MRAVGRRAAEREQAVAAPRATPLRPVPSRELAHAIGNRAMGRVLQRYVKGAALAVHGANEFTAQVKQPSGSFRTAAGVQTATAAATTTLRISEDGQLAIEDSDLGARQPKVFYATSKVVERSNKALKSHKSEFRLHVEQTDAITVASMDGKPVRLHRIVPERKTVANPATDRGTGVTVEQVCDKVASRIVGKDVADVLPKLKKSLGLKDASVLGHEYKVARYFADVVASTKSAAKKNVNTPSGDVASATGKATMDTITQAYMQVILHAPVVARQIAEELGVNEFADPKVGQAYGSWSLGGTSLAGIPDYAQPGNPMRQATFDAPASASHYGRDIWATHFGAVVAESGGNKITLENYGRKHEDGQNLSNDPIYYFQMYGPGSAGGQSWYEAWNAGANPTINTITMVYG
jgi:hypothetical protein